MIKITKQETELGERQKTETPRDSTTDPRPPWHRQRPGTVSTKEIEQALEEVGLNLWIPMTGADAALLGKLGEELNECGAAAARCLTQGIGEREPVTSKPNKEWLEDEIADVWAMTNLAIKRFGLDVSRIHTRNVDKQQRKQVWLDALDTLNGKRKST